MDSNPDVTRRRRLIVMKSTQIFLVAAIVLMSLFITVLCIGFLVRYEVGTDIWNVDSVSYWKEELTDEQKFWYNDGIEELKAALKIKWEMATASNVILFMAHGIGEAALAAARFDENSVGPHHMVWEDFSHTGYVITNCSASVPCDASSFGTALFGGVHTRHGLVGLDDAVAAQNCIESMNDTHHVKSILKMSQDSGFRNGFVTTRRVGGSLMAALYAQSPDTNWECDALVPSGKVLQGCTDIATQLIDDETGININVVMGGGRQTLVSYTPASTWDPIDSRACNSRDDRNYIRAWRTLKRARQQRFAVVQNAFELNRLNGSKVDFALGIFANGNVSPPWQHNTTDNHMPDLSDMVKKALEILKRKEERFFLVVESGNIIEGSIAEQIHELRQLNETIDKATKAASADTLVVVLFGEDNDRGVDIEATKDGAEANDDVVVTGDLRVLATGPGSFLFHGLHDETYIAHAVASALKIGPFREPIQRKP